MSRNKTLLIVIVILAVSMTLAWLILSTQPKSQKARPQVPSPLVNVVEASRADAEVYITALGSLTASQHTMVKARVSGQVLSFGENADVGSIVEEGELLVQLDDAVYQNTLRSRESALVQAKASYDLEIGQQNVAKAEVAQLNQLSGVLSQMGNTGRANSGVSLSAQGTALALRKPQLEQAKAMVSGAEADMDMAKLNLAYTKVLSPYNAIIVNRNTSLGSQATTSETLFEIVGTDEYRVEASIPLDKIQSLNLLEGKDQEARVISSTGVERIGVVENHIASLDEKTRMGRILITVSDPLGLENKEAPLILGDQVSVELSVGLFKDVFVVPRNALHSNDTVYVAIPKENSPRSENSPNGQGAPNAPSAEGAQENKNPENAQDKSEKQSYELDIRPVKVAWKDIDFVYITDGINNDEYLIISLVPAPIDGMPVTVQNIEKVAD